MVFEIFALLILFQLKHFVCDYPLQGKYMLGKFKPGWDFVPPLAAHAGVQAAFTLLISFCYSQNVWLSLALACLDFVTHFVIDRIKAGPNWLGRYRDTQTPEFWWCLGGDQMAHHLVHYVIIFILFVCQG